MLIARAPMRVSFAGGGTDLEAYYARYGGRVVSTTINKYVYTIVTMEKTEDVQLVSADYRSFVRQLPYQDLYWDGDLALPRAVLQHFGVRHGLNLFLASEVPPGTGLGSSSAVAVVLVRALAALLERPMTKQQVAELASTIEIDRLGMPIGKQDQYASSFGGLNIITFTSQGVTVEPVQIAPQAQQALERRLLLFFTGSSRVSTSILTQQRRSTQAEDPVVLQSLHHIKRMAGEVRVCLERGDLDEFAQLLDTGWQEKRRLAPGLSTSFIDDCYRVALEHGAMGGKITGAGGGGFMLLYCPEHAQQVVTNVLEERGLKRMSFRLTQEGARVLLDDAKADCQ
jgi:D-glycero-alpha-D-manno-heptose-7-phosphate kinase